MNRYESCRDYSVGTLNEKLPQPEVVRLWSAEVPWTPARTGYFRNAKAELLHSLAGYRLVKGSSINPNAAV